MFKVTTSRQRTKAVFGVTHFVDLGPDKRSMTIEEHSFLYVLRDRILLFSSSSKYNAHRICTTHTRTLICTRYGSLLIVLGKKREYEYKTMIEKVLIRVDEGNKKLFRTSSVSS